jgi:hypothetical protein
MGPCTREDSGGQGEAAVLLPPPGRSRVRGGLTGEDGWVSDEMAFEGEGEKMAGKGERGGGGEKLTGAAAADSFGSLAVSPLRHERDCERPCSVPRRSGTHGGDLRIVGVPFCTQGRGAWNWTPFRGPKSTCIQTAEMEARNPDSPILSLIPCASKHSFIVFCRIGNWGKHVLFI